MGWATGRRYRYQPPSQDSSKKGAILFWAEKGSICIVDERYPEASDEHFTVLSIREWLHNLQALNHSVGRYKYADERNALQLLIENGVRCAKEAQRQGDPVNPTHVRDMVLRRRKSMLLAGKGDYFKEGALASAVAPENALLPALARPQRILTSQDLE